jgi:hypothetical protein
MHLDEDYAAHNVEVTLGDYVMLAVTTEGRVAASDSGPRPVMLGRLRD